MRIGILAIVILLALFIGVANRQPQTVLAQEDIEPFLQCSGPEIPVGTVRDETDRLSQEVVRLVFQLAQDAKAERKAAKEFIPSSDECNANRCVSSCTVNFFKQCVAEPAKGCGGEACDREEIEGRLKNVEAAYEQLQKTRQALSDLLHKRRPSPFVTTDYCASDQCNNDYGIAGCTQKCQQRTWREHILFNLEEARNGLEACVTPANFYDTGESDQDVDFPMSCQEARLSKALSEAQAAQCFINNFFCCTLKPQQ